MKKLNKLMYFVFIFLTSISLFSSCSKDSSTIVNSEDKQKLVDYINNNRGNEESIIICKLWTMVTTRLGYVNDKFVLTINYNYEENNNYTIVTFDYMDKQLDCQYFIYDNDILLTSLTCKINIYRHQYYGYDRSSIKVGQVTYNDDYESFDKIINNMDAWLTYSFLYFENTLEENSLPYVY